MKCRHCFVLLDSNRHGTFCSKSCRASFTNLNREVREETGSKISEGLKRHNSAKQERGETTFPKRLDRIQEPFSRIFINVCHHCGSKVVARIKQKYCEQHAELYKRKERERFSFTFKFEQYPELFDLDEIQRLGLYHPKCNPNGLTRDHKVSVNEALRNGYDAFYIKHPLNCEVMTQSKNSSKKAKSSITYYELKRMVDEFEMMAPVSGFEPDFTD